NPLSSTICSKTRSSAPPTNPYFGVTTRLIPLWQQIAFNKQVPGYADALISLKKPIMVLVTACILKKSATSSNFSTNTCKKLYPRETRAQQQVLTAQPWCCALWDEVFGVRMARLETLSSTPS